MAEHDMDSAEVRDRSYRMSPETEAAWRGDEVLAAEGKPEQAELAARRRDLDWGDVSDDARRDPTVDPVGDWRTEQATRPDISAAEVAEEIAAYLPNTGGHFQQVIETAHVMPDGTIELGLVNGQAMRLRIVTEHNAQ